MTDLPQTDSALAKPPPPRRRGGLPRRVEETRRRDGFETRLDLAAARARLESRGGATYWRSLEELAETPAFGELLDREFPRFAAEWPDGVSRRNFLQLAAASLVSPASPPARASRSRRSLPYVRQSEEFLPGKPVLYATSMALSGFATGLLIESHNGRPTKVEGNPEHPASLGASDAVTQASVLGLYDPDRSQAIRYLGDSATWTALNQQVTAALNAQSAFGGAGIRLLTGPVTSAHRGAADLEPARELSAGALAPLGCAGAGRRHQTA